MIPKEIHQITLADLQALVNSAVEDRTTEFKSAMPGKNGDPLPFLGGVSALANTAGGDFILGVAATKGIAREVVGIECADVDAEKLRFESLLADGLEPRLPRVEIRSVFVSEGRYVFVLRVGRSWIGPHRVKRNQKFYRRNSAGNFPMDVTELRTAFLSGATAAERARNFRAERLAKIAAGLGPDGPTSESKLVLHVVPLQAFGEETFLDLVSILSSIGHVPLPLDGPSGINRDTFNLDGYLNFAEPTTLGIQSYAQLFRSGAIEGVSLLNRRDDMPYIVGTLAAKKLVTSTKQYMDVFNALGLPPPFMVGISWCSRDGLCMAYQGHDGLPYRTHPLKDEVVSIPEIVVQSHSDFLPHVLRPAFHTIWNAFGFKRCDLYGEDGEWKGETKGGRNDV